MNPHADRFTTGAADIIEAARRRAEPGQMLAAMLDVAPDVAALADALRAEAGADGPARRAINTAEAGAAERLAALAVETTGQGRAAVIWRALDYIRGRSGHLTEAARTLAEALDVAPAGAATLAEQAAEELAALRATVAGLRARLEERATEAERLTEAARLARAGEIHERHERAEAEKARDALRRAARHHESRADRLRQRTEAAAAALALYPPAEALETARNWPGPPEAEAREAEQAGAATPPDALAGAIRAADILAAALEDERRAEAEAGTEARA